MKCTARLREAILAVPVFVKVMGIAVGLTALYGLGSFWQIHSARHQMLREERANSHTPAELAVIEDHLARETEFLTRRLARVLSALALAGIGLAWWLTKILTAPLDQLVRVARRVQQGDLTARVPVRVHDELGDLARAFNEMTATLAQKEQARQQLLRQLIAAGEEERKRVARELHDQTGQALTSLIAGLSSLEKSCPKAVEMRALAEQTLAEVHELSVALRPALLDDLGLWPAIRRHCETVAGQFGVEVDCQAVGLDNGQRLPAEIEVALYRITQEALTNALRHGEATRISVLLQRRDHAVLAVIEDNGRGFDAAHWRAHPGKQTHLGLTGIEERAALLGGTLRVESAPGRGTSLFVELPV